VRGVIARALEHPASHAYKRGARAMQENDQGGMEAKADGDGASSLQDMGRYL
jgi:hypothetical protein